MSRERRPLRPKKTSLARQGEYARHTGFGVGSPKYGIEPDAAGTNGAGHPAHSWSEGDAGARPSCALWRRDQKPQQSRPTRSRPLPGGHHVSTDTGRGTSLCRFKVPIWNLEARAELQHQNNQPALPHEKEYADLSQARGPDLQGSARSRTIP